MGTEQPGVNRRPGTGERDEGHRKMRIFDSECERGANLIAVKRTMAFRTHPARAPTRPVSHIVRTRRRIFACTIATIAGPSRTEILIPAAAEKSFETEAAVEGYSLVRIAFAGRNRVADAGDEHVADGKLLRDTLHGAIAKQHIDRRQCRSSIGQAQLDLLFTWRLDLPRPLAAVECPRAT